MSKNTDYIKDFKDTSKKDINMVGGKGANLGEMTQTGLPVPPGFTVTSSAFQTFLTEAGLQDFIKEKLTNLDREDSKLLQKRAEEIKKKIVASEMPKQIETEIGKAYKKLSKGDDAFVAVRSSATAEDLPGASFAGQQETYLDVRGIDDVIQSIKMAWASLLNRGLYFIGKKKVLIIFK